VTATQDAHLHIKHIAQIIWIASRATECRPRICKTRKGENGWSPYHLNHLNHPLLLSSPPSFTPSIRVIPPSSEEEEEEEEEEDKDG